MKSLYRLGLLAGVMVVIGILVAFPSLTHADTSTPLTPDQEQAIKDNCSLIKNTLSQLQISDTLLRVNRGQFYESMSAKLMDHFNTRLANNNIDNTAFSSMTTSYDNALLSFQNDYRTYDEQLTATLAVDCKNHPSAFNDAVVSSRNLRFKVHTDVQKLNQYIASYQALIDNFANHYQQGTNGGSQ